MSLPRTLETLLPADFGAWLSRRFGIYVSVALLTGFALLASAWLQVNAYSSLAVSALGSLLGLAGILILLLTSWNIVPPWAHRTKLAHLRGTVVLIDQLENVQTDIDQATIAQMIILLLQLKDAGFDQDAIQKLVEQLRSRQSR